MTLYAAIYVTEWYSTRIVRVRRSDLVFEDLQAALLHLLDWPPPTRSKRQCPVLLSGFSVEVSQLELLPRNFQNDPYRWRVRCQAPATFRYNVTATDLLHVRTERHMTTGKNDDDFLPL